MSSQSASPSVTDTNWQVKDRFDNFNAQIAVISAKFTNKIYDLKNEVDKWKLKIIDQNDDMSDKSKLSLLEYK